jgi:hypothetical protein
MLARQSRTKMEALGPTPNIDGKIPRALLRGIRPKMKEANTQVIRYAW